MIIDAAELAAGVAKAALTQQQEDAQATLLNKFTGSGAGDEDLLDI